MMRVRGDCMSLMSIEFRPVFQHYHEYAWDDVWFSSGFYVAKTLSNISRTEKHAELRSKTCPITTSQVTN